MTSPLQYLLAAIAAFAAGLVNALAGGGTLITFPALTALGLPAVFGGAIITEQVFRVNGLGQLLISAIHANDIPMVLTLTFIFAILIVVFTLIADLLYGILDPRIRYD